MNKIYLSQKYFIHIKLNKIFCLVAKIYSKDNKNNEYPFHSNDLFILNRRFSPVTVINIGIKLANASIGKLSKCINLFFIISYSLVLRK